MKKFLNVVLSLLGLGGFIGMNSATAATSADDSTGPVTIGVNPSNHPNINPGGKVSASEAAGIMVFTLVKTGTTNGTTTVHVQTQNGTATSTNNYVSVNGNWTFAAGQTVNFVTVSITNDMVHEGDQTFSLILSSPNPADTELKPAIGTGTIVDDDN